MAGPLSALVDDLTHRSFENRLPLGDTVPGRVLQRGLRGRANARFERARRVPLRPAEEVFPGLASVVASVCAAGAATNPLGNVSDRELILICSACRWAEPSTCFEFGTYDGRTTRHLALNAPSARVVTIDLDPADPLRGVPGPDTFYTKQVVVGEQFADTPEAGRIEQRFGDTRSFDPGDLRGSVDFVFVDGGHLADCVRADTATALAMLRPGGVALWHDYHFSHEGVYATLNDLASRAELFNLAGTSIVAHRSPAG